MQTEINKQTVKRQKYLGDTGFVVFLIFISAFIPLSTDVYLPALPRMVESLQTTPGLINLTIVGFFIFYAVGTMFWGPLSDKYGRRPVLLSGMGLYLAASLGCATAGHVYQLIACRIVQAIGCGAATAVATAMVKDVYEGQERLKILALVQSMGMLVPIVAPVIGALVLAWLSWQGVFWVLAIIGLVALGGSLAMEETLAVRQSGSILTSIGRLGVVLQNKPFRQLLLMFSLMAAPMMSYITASAYVYVDGFGVSEQMYSYFFGVNAVFFMIGPLAYIRLVKRYPSHALITASFALTALSGLALLGIGHRSPWVFALCIMPASFFGSLIGPPRTHLMLEQLQGDTGAASSLMSCAFTFFGSSGMLLISLEGYDRITLMGSLYLLVSLLSLAAWLVIARKPYIKQAAYPPHAR